MELATIDRPDGGENQAGRKRRSEAERLAAKALMDARRAAAEQRRLEREADRAEAEKRRREKLERSEALSRGVAKLADRVVAQGHRASTWQEERKAEAQRVKKLRKRLKKRHEYKEPAPPPPPPDYLSPREAVTGVNATTEAQKLEARARMREWVDMAIPQAPVPTEWTAEHVQVRLVEAVKTLRRIPMRTRPKGFGTCWPMHPYEATDIRYQLELRSRDATIMKTKCLPSSEEMILMDEAIAWPMTYLNDEPEIARAVVLGSLWEATGASIADKCRKFKLGRSLFYTRRRAGLNIIAICLTASRQPVR